VICDLAVGSREDIFLLELLRRVAPVVPLILVASGGSLVTQRLVQGLRPMYYMVGPVEGPELQEAVEAALARRPRARG
jgi:DNA-binding NarL/FixJ family response regulator